MESRNKTIVVAEDDKFLRKACEVSLQRMGFNVRSARDGEEALRIIGDEAPDLILLDLLMPRVNGIEVLRSVRSKEITRSTPVLILTNSSRDQDIKEVHSLGVQGYQIKA